LLWKALVRSLWDLDSESSLMLSPGSAAYHYLLREQNKAHPDVLESTTSHHFLAFFVSGSYVYCFHNTLRVLTVLLLHLQPAFSPASFRTS
jgi:hypothetical protein